MLDNLRIDILDMNLAFQQPYLMSDLRALTLRPNWGLESGLNCELNMLQALYLERPVNAHAVLAYLDPNLVGWALCSKEPSNFTFSTGSKFEGEGVLFEVYVDYQHRGKGIATALLQKAHEKFNNDMLYVCPWDSVSRMFYQKNAHIPYQVI